MCVCVCVCVCVCWPESPPPGSYISCYWCLCVCVCVMCVDWPESPPSSPPPLPGSYTSDPVTSVCVCVCVYVDVLCNVIILLGK